MISKLKQFFSEVKVELGKVSWSTRQELISATTVVIVITFILSVYIGIVDFALSKALTLLVR